MTAPPAVTAVLPGGGTLPLPVSAPAPAAASGGSTAMLDAAAPLGEPGAETRQYSREELRPFAAEAGIAIAPDYRPAYALVVIDGGDGAVGATLLRALKTAYPDVALLPVGLGAPAQAAMKAALGDEAPPLTVADALAQAAGVFAPTDVMLPGAFDGDVTEDLVEALAHSPAKIRLLPPRSARLGWVAAPQWPLARWVENAVIEAGNLLDALDQAM
jgi:hypothetical protein